MRRGELAILDGENARRHLVLEIARGARDTGSGAGLVEPLAEFGHAVGNADHRAQRRDAIGLAEELQKALAQAEQDRLDIVVLRIEGKHLLGL